MVPMEGHQLPGVGYFDSMDIAVAGHLARSAQDLQLAMQVLTTTLQQFGPLVWAPAQWRKTKKPLVNAAWPSCMTTARREWTRAFRNHYTL
jgi:amidase